MEPSRFESLKGIITALVTPFRNGQVDYESLENLITDQLKQGVQGCVVNGTTGESPCLLQSEVKDIFLFLKGIVPKDFIMIMGTGSNSTAKSIANTRFAKDLGVDAALTVVPYYNKPPQRGLVQHFEAIANEGGLPVLLYNVPGRTIASLEFDSIQTLSRHPGIIGIKEASGDIALAERISKELEGFALLSGDDGSYVDFLRVGGQGVISVSSHLIGSEMKEWTQKVKGNPEARVENQRWSQFLDLLGVEANPIPVKMALYLKGLIASPELRLPLVTLSGESTEKLKSEMLKQGLME